MFAFCSSEPLIFKSFIKVVRPVFGIKSTGRFSSLVGPGIFLIHFSWLQDMFMDSFARKGFCLKGKHSKVLPW